MFDDGDHVPIVIQEIVGVADFQVLRFGGPVVNKQVVRPSMSCPCRKTTSGHGAKTSESMP